jgi:hypothetical protein
VPQLVSPEIDLPDGVRVRVDSSVNEKALRREMGDILSNSGPVAAFL